jgi:hypothetical protein
MLQIHANNYGFVILCPERNFGGLKVTARSIESFFPNQHYLCVVGDDVSKEEFSEFNGICRTIRAGKTYSSLINTGLSESRTDWSLFFMAGHTARPGVMSRYLHFCKNDKHVLFPVIDRKWQFHEASIHGLFMHKKAVKEVGPFTDQEEDFQTVKLLWAGSALEKGYQFRALVGVPR